MAIPLISNDLVMALLAVLTAAAGYGAHALRLAIRSAHRRQPTAEQIARSNARWLAKLRYQLWTEAGVRPYVRVDKWGARHYSLVPLDTPTDAEEQETLR